MPKPTTPKRKTSIALTDEATRLLVSLAEARGLTKQGVIESLIREAAKREKVR